MKCIFKKINIRSHVIKVMIPFAILLTVLTVILYISIDQYFIRLYSDKVCDIEIDLLEQKNNSLTYLTENLENTVNYMRLNNSIMQLCYESPKDIYELRESERQLNSVRISTPLIDSIYLFNNKTGKIHVTINQGDKQYTRDDFFDQEIFSLLDDINSYGTYTPMARAITLPNGKNKNVLTYITYDYFSEKNYLDGIIVINIPIDVVTRKLDIKNYSSEDREKLVLIDEKGCVTYSSDNSEFLMDKSEEEYVRKVLDSGTKRGSFIVEINGSPSFVTYLKNAYSNWTFIRMTAYSDIVSQLYPIQFFSALISLGIFSIGMFFVWILSRRLADNQRKMEQQVKGLQEKDRLHAATRRNDFMRLLIKGNVPGEIEKVCEKFSEYQIKTVASEDYFLIIFEIDRFQSFCKSCNLDERNVKMKEFQEIIDRRISEHYRCDVSQISEHQMLALCNITDFSDIFQISEKLSVLLVELQKEVERKLIFYTSAAISEVGHTYKELPYLYEEAVEDMQYRYLFGHCAMIFPFMLPEKREQIPVEELRQLENTMLNALNKLKREELEEALRKYMEKLTTRVPYEIRMLLMNLLMQANNSINGSMMSQDADTFDMQELLQDIVNAETLEESQRLISCVFGEIFDLLEEKRQSRYKTMMSEVKAYIETNYATEALSINTIADDLKLSIAYLGRIFKNLEGLSISDYIMQIRLEHAENYLLHSEISVNEIARQLGFTNSSYFYYVFKRKYQMTPSQYRLLKKSEH